MLEQFGGLGLGIVAGWLGSAPRMTTRNVILPTIGALIVVPAFALLFAPGTAVRFIIAFAVCFAVRRLMLSIIGGR